MTLSGRAALVHGPVIDGNYSVVHRLLEGGRRKTFTVAYGFSKSIRRDKSSEQVVRAP